NNLVLFYRHLGVPGEAVKLWQKGDKAALAAHPQGPKMLEFAEIMDDLKAEVKRTGVLAVEAVYRFFPAASDGNALFLYGKEGVTPKPLATFEFPRQAKEEGFCLSDYAHPLSASNAGKMDHVALFCVTAGKGVRARSEELKKRGEYLKA